MTKKQREESREKIIKLNQLIQATRTIINPGNRFTLKVFVGEDYGKLNRYEQKLFNLLSIEMYKLMEEEFDLLDDEIQKELKELNKHYKK